MSSKNCSKCQGSGLQETQTKRCLVCQGKKCIQCNETGFERLPYEECSTCSGTGEKDGKGNLIKGKM